tara:strand:+ start:233848 stop:234966 length:1119 start_codon:yes stop_codon:yes gene_type:complete
VDKQRLTTLINQPEKLEENDFRDLANLKKEFPYFQALSPLITLGSKKYSPETEKKQLQTSAIYALDRKHLKEILTKDYIQAVKKVEPVENTYRQENEVRIAKNKVIESPSVDRKKVEQKTEYVSKPIIESSAITDSSHLPDSFFEELFKDMEALKEEKEKYQKTLEKFESKKTTATKSKTATTKKTSSKTTTKKAASPKPTSAKKATTQKPKAATTKKTSSAKKQPSSKKATTTKTKTTTTKVPVSKSKKTSKKPKKDEHDIIEEITSRKELKISDAHKKEQLDIINSFIEKEPVLTKRLDPDNQSNKQEAEDLSANSTNLSDDVVSETLAKLMIKQGRKQKAIDIYKKLIWKFPQKKTYFVEIIDELKKES